MLILLPPSEGKTAPVHGPRLMLESLFAAEVLTQARRDVLGALSEVSASTQAAQVLGLGPRSAHEAALNCVVDSVPCAPAVELFTGVLYDAAEFSDMCGGRGAGSTGRCADDAHVPGGSASSSSAVAATPESGEQAESEECSAESVTRACAVVREEVLIASGAWGMVRGMDLLPDHRVSMGVSLPGCGKLAAWWKPRLAPVMDDLTAGQVVVDCRSGAYGPVWQPRAGSDSQVLRVKVMTPRPDGGLSVVSHHAKHARGLLAGALVRARVAGVLSADGSVDDVVALAADLPAVQDVRLGEWDRQGRADLTLVVTRV